MAGFPVQPQIYHLNDQFRETSRRSPPNPAGGLFGAGHGPATRLGSLISLLNDPANCGRNPRIEIGFRSMCSDEQQLPGGVFSTWLSEVDAALNTGSGIDVPCGDCIACCKSHQFIHIEPTETETLSRIPKELLFPAPGEGPGNMLMGYDEHGCCPMLVEDSCSIYSHRPRTCRTYDCRVFPASDIKNTEIDIPLIAHQAQRWKFTYETRHDQDLRSAVQATADFLRRHPECFADGSPHNATHLATMAIKAHKVFVRMDEERKNTGQIPEDRKVVEAIIAEIRN